MSTLLIFLIFITTISTANPANILGIFPMPGKSHFMMFECLLKRLAEVGHNVDVVTHFPSHEILPRYREFSILGSIPILHNNISVNFFGSLSTLEIIHMMGTVFGVDMCTTLFNTSIVKDLRNNTKKYDVIITHLFGSDCMLGFGHLFKAPTISIISSTSLPWANDRIDNPDNPSYIPNYFVSSSSTMTFYERIENSVSLVVFKLLYNFISKSSNGPNRDFFGADFPQLEEVVQKTSLILVNSHSSISHMRPTVPNFIEIGGLHMKAPKHLSEYFEDLVTTDTKGIIYFTMGSMVLSETFTYEKLQGIFDAFAELPYKVLWKATRERFPAGLRIPKNIHFEKWLPQMDILCHPNIKLFVTHGGLFSSQEATFCGVPRLGIPLFADQVSNIRAAERQGIAIKVDYKNINKMTILTATKKLLEDKSYKENCDRVSRRFKDRPISPLNTAVYWIEYVIRYKAAPQLRSVGVELPWYEYYFVDVTVIFFAVFAIFGVLVTVLLRVLLKFVLYICN